MRSTEETAESKGIAALVAIPSTPATQNIVGQSSISFASPQPQTGLPTSEVEIGARQYAR